MTEPRDSASPAPLHSPLVERAMRWAARGHRNQHRKASDLPYLSHPASVALLLARAGIDDAEILAAALLHDVVEDTACSLETLATAFPARVVNFVAALTERKLDGDGQKRSWRDRKVEHLASIAAAPWEARAIALGDKLHNLEAMLFDLELGEDLWSRFNAPAAEILWYHREMIASAYQDDPRLQILAAACRETLCELERKRDRRGKRGQVRMALSRV